MNIDFNRLDFMTSSKEHSKMVKSASEVVAKKDRKVSAKDKRNRTLSLHDENYEKLNTYCNQNKLKPSQVIDELIVEFLKNLGKMSEK